MRSRLPDVGPVIVSIPGVSGTLMTGATSITVFYRWRSSYMLTGLFFRTLTTGLSSNMFLSIQDDARNELIANGFGLTEANAVALPANGQAADPTLGQPQVLRWMPMQRYVHRGEQWRFIVRSLGSVRPELLFRLESPLWQDATKMRGRP